MPETKNNVHNEKPISLAPLDLKEALKALMDTPPETKRKKRKKNKKKAK